MEARLKRDIALVGHAHAGKTSLAESLLFVAGVTSRKGDVNKGNSVSDFNEDEIARQISINSSLLTAYFNNHQIQIIDTPGYSDFIGETISALRAVDAAIVVVDAINGVEAGTADIWEKLSEMNMPRLIFINKTDKAEVHTAQVIASIREELSPKAHVVDFSDPSFIEAVAETDDQLIEKYLEKGSLSADEVVTALHRAVAQAQLFPILSGSALTDKGIKDLLEAVLSYLPSPIEHPALQAHIPRSEETKCVIPSEEAPLSGFVFKSMFDPHLGHLSLVRILSGTLKPNMSFLNANQGLKEVVSSITMLKGKEQIAVSQASCGDIVALPKLKNTHACDTLCEDKEPIVFDPIAFPEPSISASVKPKTRADEEKISASLHRLCEEDHTFRVHRDNDTKELIVSGVGDLHLKVILERMKNRYHVDVDLGTPKVSYREAITRTARARYRYKKQSGGRGQYGDVELELSPLPREGQEFEFVDKIFGGAIPRSYVPSVEKGVRQAFHDGILAGCPMMNVRVTVVDGSYHDVDSSDMAFQIAAAMAFKDAAKLAAPVILEPIMETNIVIPDEFVGQVTKDVSSRRGKIMGSEAKGKSQAIKALMPLTEMFKYATDLRSVTAGRGQYTMKFSHYEKASEKATAQVVLEHQNQRKE